MCSSLDEHSSHHRRSNQQHLLNLTVTPAFPIFISSDIAIIKESAIIQVSRSRSSSIIEAEELNPENQSKIFSSDSLLWDRLSLISTESVASVSSEFEKSGCSGQPFDEEKICLQLSDWLIQSMEERRWRQLTEAIDFREPVDPTLYLRSAADPDEQAEEAEEEEFRREEGNSIFYANSQLPHHQQQPGCSQMPSTSRVYEVAEPGQDSPTCSHVSRQSSTHSLRRRFSEGDCAEVNNNNEIEASELGLTRSNSVQELITALADTAAFQNSLKRAELVRTFNAPQLQIAHRNWRPPKKKFIFELLKPNDFLSQLALQKHRCAGCGLKLDRIYAKRAQFCHYFSKLYCQCCHQGAKTRIPARILHEWNFKAYPVCDAALNFLADNEDQPVFNVRLINPQLYKKARNLRRFRKMRQKIAHMWPFIQMCRLAGELTTEHGILRTMFTSVPKRFLSPECVDVFSLLDFERIANRNLLELLEPVVTLGAAHIEGCLYCRQHAFFCQLCMDPCDLLFPFQLERCHRCEGCGSLSHKKCLKKAAAAAEATTSNHGGEDEEEPTMVRCEKCERIRRKKLRLQQKHGSSDQSGRDSE